MTCGSGAEIGEQLGLYALQARVHFGFGGGRGALLALFVKKGDALAGYRVGAEIGIFLNALEAVGGLGFSA